MSQGKLWATVLIWGLLLSSALYYIVFHVSIDAGISVFLPADHQDSIVQQFAIEQARGGQSSRLLMLELSGDDPDTLASASHHLYQFLEKHTDIYLVNNGERQLSSSERSVIFQYRYLLSPSMDDEPLSSQYLKSELNNRLRELASTLPSVDKRLIPEDPTMELRQYLLNLPVSKQPVKFNGVWFTENSSKAVLVIYLKQQGYNADTLADLMADVSAETKRKFINETIKIEWAGPGIFAYESRRIIETETRLFTVVASIVVLFIMFLFYRSVLYLMLATLPLLVAVIVATALTHIAYSGIHGITLAFGVILLGIAIDYPVHYFSHSRRVQQSGEGMRRIWSTVFLGMITSSLGFSVMWMSDFEGLRQLGFFSMTGLLSAALCTRWLLPVFPLSAKAYISHEWLILLPYQLLIKYRWVLLIVIWLGMAFFVVKGGYSVAVNGLRQLSPIPAEVFNKDRELRRDLGLADSNRFILIAADSSEQALQLTETVTRELSTEYYRDVKHQVLSASQILPSQITQERRRQLLPGEEKLRADLKSALSGMPFKPAVFEGFINDVTSTEKLQILDVDSFKRMLGEGLLGLQMNFLLQQSGQQWYSLVKLVDFGESEPLVQWLDAKAYKNVYYLDVGMTVDELVKGFMYDIIEKSIYGLMLIVIVLLVALKSIKRTQAVIMPVVLAIIFTLGSLLVVGTGISLFHLVSLLLVLGIGIDYGLFMTRPESSIDKRDSLHSLLVCVLSTTIVFMIISFSDILVLHAIGSTVAIGVFSSFVFSVFFSLPNHKKSLRI